MRHLTIAVLLAVAHPVHAQVPTAILTKAEAAYGRIHTLHASFVQELVNPMMGNETTHGQLFLSPPHRFAMRFSYPEGDRIVADGTWLWLHTPSSVPDQVIRQPIPESGPATPNLFAQFVDRPLDRYDATYVGPDSAAGFAVENVRMIPRVEGIPFRSVVISISQDGMLRKIALVEESGQRRVLVFEEIAVNGLIADEEFEFEVPRGTRIVTP